MAAINIHLEWPESAVTLPETWEETNPQAKSNTYRLLRVLQRYQIKATFYVLGHIAKHDPELIQIIHKQGHQIGSHGMWHRHGEREGDISYHVAAWHIYTALEAKVSGPYPYCSPFWDSTPRPGCSGGVFFRTLPYALLKQQIRHYNSIYLHPHDMAPSAYGPWRRHFFFTKPWERLERLLNEKGLFHD